MILSQRVLYVPDETDHPRGDEYPTEARVWKWMLTKKAGQ